MQELINKLNTTPLQNIIQEWLKNTKKYEHEITRVMSYIKDLETENSALNKSFDWFKKQLEYKDVELEAIKKLSMDNYISGKKLYDEKQALINIFRKDIDGGNNTRFSSQEILDFINKVEG